MIVLTPNPTRYAESGRARFVRAFIPCRLASASLALVAFASGAIAQTTDIAPTSPSALKQMSLEELTNVEVTSVSRHPEKLSDAASAIQVITAEDIRRSGFFAPC